MRAGSGQSTHAETRVATRDALQQALQQLGSERATAGFLFVSPKHALTNVMAVAAEMAPGCEFLACQTAGEFTERGRTTGGVAALLTTLPRESFEVAGAAGMRTDPLGVARQLTAPFNALKERANRVGAGLSTTVLLVDGLAGTGERVVKEVLNTTRLFQQVVGGASGDDGKFAATEVGTTRTQGVDAAVALHVFSKHPWGVGVDHGLAPRTRPMVATRAEGNVLYEIDKRPALEVYKEFARSKGVELDDANTPAFLIGNELGVFFLNELHHARAPVGVGPNGELKLVADLMQGSQICILDGETEPMVAAATRAAEQARAGLQGTKAAGVLVFDCICRGMILKSDFQKEIDAVRKVFPDVPLAGFLTYGEIARFRGKLDGWHNTTAVVLAIPE
ncbi:MAG: FIST C-terminal domain-containing protein [Archangium sp.]